MSEISKRSREKGVDNSKFMAHDHKQVAKIFRKRSCALLADVMCVMSDVSTVKCVFEMSIPNRQNLNKEVESDASK